MNDVLFIHVTCAFTYVSHASLQHIPLTHFWLGCEICFLKLIFCPLCILQAQPKLHAQFASTLLMNGNLSILFLELSCFPLWSSEDFKEYNFSLRNLSQTDMCQSVSFIFIGLRKRWLLFDKILTSFAFEPSSDANTWCRSTSRLVTDSHVYWTWNTPRK